MEKITIKYLMENHKLTYTSYLSMIYRCLIDKEDDFYYKKIEICQRWREPKHIGFVNFLNDMGERPSPIHTIDRKGGGTTPYEPNNCRWSTRKEQAYNRKSTIILTYNNNEMCLSDWAKVIGVSKSRMTQYVKSGMDINDILNFNKYKKWKDIKFDYNGKSLNINDWSRLVGISTQILKCRIFECGWSIEKAFTTPVITKKKKVKI